MRGVYFYVILLNNAKKIQTEIEKIILNNDNRYDEIVGHGKMN